MKISVGSNINLDSDLHIFRSDKILDEIKLEDYKTDKACVTPLYIKDGFLCLSFINKDKVYTQKSITLNQDYKNLKRSKEINIVTFDNLKIGLVVDTDIYHPEIIRYLKLKGCDFIISSQMFDEDYNETLILDGAWRESEANTILIVNVSNISTNVLNECYITENKDGFIIRNEKNETSFNIDEKVLYKGNIAFPIFQSLNKELYKKEFDK